jgi:guanylate kinase
MAAEAEFDVTVVNDNVEHAAEELVGLLGSRLFTSQPLH